jgi:hypothetical protein
MQRKAGNDPEGGRKKRKEVCNDNSLASMFAKKQAVSALNKARDAYNAQFQKGKEMGLEEVAQAEPVRRSERDIHDVEGTKTVHATVPKRQIDTPLVLCFQHLFLLFVFIVTTFVFIVLFLLFFNWVLLAVNSVEKQ